MLDNQGFNLWAQEYDGSVRRSDENNRYPFAGYQDIMNEIFRRVLSAPDGMFWISGLAPVF